jgi:hypothetical protein
MQVGPFLPPQHFVLFFICSSVLPAAALPKFQDGAGRLTFIGSRRSVACLFIGDE